MFLKGGAFQELVLLSLNVGITKLDSLYKKLSIFAKEEINKELLLLHNAKIIEFDINNKQIILTKKMKDTIMFLSESKIVESFNSGTMSPYLAKLSSKVAIDLNHELTATINNCLSCLYKTDFSNEVSVLSLNTKKRDSYEH